MDAAALVPYLNPYGPRGPMRTLHTRYDIHLERPIDSPPMEHSKTLKEEAKETLDDVRQKAHDMGDKVRKSIDKLRDAIPPYLRR
jgi:hypothetical protein